MILESIDEELIKQFDKLSVIVTDMEFQPICEFTPENASTNIPWKDIVYSGVYLIEVKTDYKNLEFLEWLGDFQNGWEHKDYKKKFTPNFTKKRISAHKSLAEWMPLYIGKSKQIGGRIHNHLYKELHKPTFAMKLLARKNLQKEMFRLSTIKVEVNNYNAIMPKIESQLRNKINPLIGRQ